MRHLTLLIAIAAMLPSAALGQSNNDPLTQAFKKEFAFLEAEQAELSRRLVELKRATQEEGRVQMKTLAGLQAEIVAQSTEADVLADSLVELERSVDRVGESEDAIAGLIQQISRSLQSKSVDWVPEFKAESATTARAAEEATYLSSGFAKAFDVLEGGSAIQRRQGAFFLASGEKVTGEIIEVGQIAVFGVSGENAGALSPAGGGQFKLDPIQGGETAKALHSGETSIDMGVFLFERATENFEPKREKTVLEIIESGGVIAWVIVGIGLFALLLIALRAILLGMTGASTDRIWSEIEAKIHANQLTEIEPICEGERGAGARVLKAIAPALSLERDDIENAFNQQMIIEEARLDRFGALTLVIAAVAPLLGLLGTVTGMISTFDVITEFGTGNPKLLSGGISEALVTTELGLCVAIPVLLLGNLLNGAAHRMKNMLEFSGLRMVNATRLAGEQPTVDLQTQRRDTSAEQPKAEPKMAPEAATLSEAS